ncbi:MAG: outer membrane protein assembly factor BamA [Desulfobacterales bacterium]|nr:outer membrane protein assembly factor BamA [Desulfobacterales bacterium]
MKHISITFLFIIFSFATILKYNLSFADTEFKSNDFTISKINIKINDGYKNTKYLENLANDIIILKPGDKFSNEGLAGSIDALKLSNKFSEINVDSVEQQNTMELIFVLKAFNYIKDIRITGMYPLFEREILNYMSIYTGDVYKPGEVLKQEELISELYKRNGFYNTKAKIESEQDEKDGNYILKIDIKRGHILRIKDFKIKGNKAFSDSRIKLMIRSSRMSVLPGFGGRFIEDNLKKEIKELEESFWQKGYPEASVNFEIKKNEDSKTVNVLLNTAEGPEYDVNFAGNDEFWGVTLKKELTIFEKGNKNDSGIRRSMENIKKLYKNNGYLDVRIKYDKHSYNEDKTTRYIILEINEGVQTIIDSINIDGNKVFDNDKIKKQMLSRIPGFFAKGVFVPEVLTDDLASIKGLYFENGYLAADIKHEVKFNENKEKAFIRININEGVQTLLDEIEFKGLSAISEQTAIKAVSLKKGKPFIKKAIQQDEIALLSLISEKGYPHVEVKSEIIMSDDNSKAKVIFNIHEGIFTKMGKAYFTGNFKTKNSVMEKEIELSPDMQFSMKKVLQGQRNIRNMDIFNSVKFSSYGLKEKSEEISLFIDVEEKKPYFIELGGGYESEKGNFFNSRVGDHNLFGRNKYGWLYGELSEIGYRGELGISDPRFLGTRTSASFSLYAEEKEEFNQDFGVFTIGSSLGLNRKLFQHLSSGISIKFERRDQYNLDSSIEGEQFDDEFDVRSIVTIIPSLSYDSRDSFIIPKKGIFSSVSAEISKGISNAQDDFIKYKFDGRKYWTVLKPLTFAFLLRAGYIYPMHEDSKIPDDQLFYLGGISSVRGFKENMLYYNSLKDPIGGKSFWSGSLEARIDIGLNFELSGFYDIGSIHEPFETIVFDDVRSSAGFGLRYMTPIGPIGFMYGIKLDRKDGESKGRLHFSLGYTF